MSDEIKTSQNQSEVNDNSLINEYLDILNVYLAYYKNLYHKPKHENMFFSTDPNIIDSTNKCMETFYDELNSYKISNEPDKNVLYDPNDIQIDMCKSLYLLMINNEQKFACKYLLPIFKYITTIEWSKTDWSIIPLK